MKRLSQNFNQFCQKNKFYDIEKKYSGLFCLLRIAKDPCEEVVNDSIT